MSDSQSSIPFLITLTVVAGGAYWYLSQPATVFDPFAVGKQPLNVLQVETYRIRDEKVKNYYKNNASYIARLDYADAHSDGVTHSASWDIAYKTTLSPLWNTEKGGFNPAPVQLPPAKRIEIKHDNFLTQPSVNSEYIAALQGGRLLDRKGNSQKVKHGRFYYVW